MNSSNKSDLKVKDALLPLINFCRDNDLGFTISFFGNGDLINIKIHSEFEEERFTAESINLNQVDLFVQECASVLTKMREQRQKPFF